jgi:DNA helicase HerA-like ATPase
LKPVKHQHITQGLAHFRRILNRSYNIFFRIARGHHRSHDISPIEHGQVHARLQRIKELAQELGAHVESLGALHRKLKRLELFTFLTPEPTEQSVVKKLLTYLDKGISVILEFGHQTSMLSYLLITGIITRHIHHHYVEKTEHFLANPSQNPEPQKLIITIEEAHKFLNTQAAKQTIFGTIAREMRKYYVSLLIVDQRPSGIVPEVLSQVGTKLVAQLNDDRG